MRSSSSGRKIEETKWYSQMYYNYFYNSFVHSFFENKIPYRAVLYYVDVKGLREDWNINWMWVDGVIAYPYIKKIIRILTLQKSFSVFHYTLQAITIHTYIFIALLIAFNKHLFMTTQKKTVVASILCIS